MTITFVRVDDRVIHGQTTTRWSKEFPIDGFIVVGDDIVNDSLRSKVLKAAAGNLKLGIYDEENAPEKIEKAKQSKNNFFLITNSPQVMARLHKKGVDFGKELNIGPLNTREGAITVGRTLSLDNLDYEAFNYLYENGIKIYFQLIPEEEKKQWPEVKAKYESLINRG